MMLLRREEDAPTSPVGKMTDRAALSESVQGTMLPALLITVVFGFYIGLHGQLTPGGGFQAGVILAHCPGFGLPGGKYRGLFSRLTSHAAVEVIEALGASSYP